VQPKIRPHARPGGSKYLCLRDFEILGARDVKRDEGERLIFLAAYSASGHLRPSDRMMALITGNTSNTLNLFAWQTLNWAAGNQYQIHKVLTVLDQPGRGKGDLISGNPPTPVGWPHQEQEPCYSWNNIHSSGGEHLNFVLGAGAGAGDTIHQNADFYNDTPMPGYTPYIYPHPLVIGGGSTPTPTPSSTPSPTPTTTPTPTYTPTPTPSPTSTPTPAPTATPTPTPAATPTPTPISQCTVPNFIGVRLNRAKSIWSNAGFTTTVTTIGPGGHKITSQSVPAGYVSSCTTTTITVTAR